jgi:hypothetical protein
MIMLGTIAAAMLLGASTGPVQVDVGKADWNAMPALKAVERDMPTPAMVGRVQTMLASGKCNLPRQTSRRFDITVPYAVLVEPEGQARRVVVAETGCPMLETYVGVLVLGMAEQGDFKPTGESKARWYASALNFNLR